MHKNRLVFFLLLFGFWLVLTQELNAQHIVTGMVLAAFLAWFWGESVQLLSPNSPNPKLYYKLFLYILALGWEIIVSNFSVAKVLLAADQQVDPLFIVFKPNLTTRWGRVLLANSITIAPGTITIDVNPDTDQFIVHAVNPDLANGVLNSKLIGKIQELESYGRRSP